MRNSALGFGTRLEALEAIRGLAALVVVAHHLAHAFWPGLLMSHWPWRSAFDGSFAVTLFFVLSGVVLSVAYFQRPAVEVAAAGALRRYFRLMPPILTAVLIAYGLMAFGAFANNATADVLGRAPDQWLRHFYKFPAKLGDALAEGTFRVFVHHDSARTYNSVLWTMGVELDGSLFVFAFLALAGKLRNRGWIYLAAGALLYLRCRYTLNFLVGIALCDIYVGQQRRPSAIQLGSMAGIALLVAGAVIGSAVPGWLGDWIGLDFSPRRLDLQTLGAAGIIAAVLFCPFWQARLRGPWLTWLGRISFSLYLIHLPVICSLGCGCFLWLYRGHGLSYALSASIAAALSVLVSLLAAQAMTGSVDRWAIALGRTIGALFLPARRRDEMVQDQRLGDAVVDLETVSWFEPAFVGRSRTNLLNDPRVPRA
jgi:peptidoglycan/LPS O-acetylase OafA/YrhL